MLGEGWHFSGVRCDWVRFPVVSRSAALDHRIQGGIPGSWHRHLIRRDAAASVCWTMRHGRCRVPLIMNLRRWRIA